jgi:hypothetical protein
MQGRLAVTKQQHQGQHSDRTTKQPAGQQNQRQGGQDGAREENTQGYDAKPDRAGQRLGDNPPSE